MAQFNNFQGTTYPRNKRYLITFPKLLLQNKMAHQKTSRLSWLLK